MSGGQNECLHDIMGLCPRTSLTALSLGPQVKKSYDRNSRT